ncbi:MAG: hypothetical protein ABIM46_02195 [candidate division WOR-3 bacterium]
MKRFALFVLGLFFGCGLLEAPAKAFGFGKKGPRIVLAYWGDQINPIGGYAKGQGWLADTQCLEYIKEGTELDIVKLGSGKIGRFKARGFTPPSEEPPDAGTVYIEGSSNTSDLNITGVEPILCILDPGGKPPKANVIPSPKQKHKELALDYLAEMGIKSEGAKGLNISQVVEADIDGDGKAETFISAQSSRDYLIFWGQSGPLYSFLVMVKSTNGKERFYPVYKEKFDSPEEAGVSVKAELMGLWDLNGDGVLEVIAQEAYYEGESFVIYSFDGEGFADKASWGAGL